MAYYRLKTGKYIETSDLRAAYEILEGESSFDKPDGFSEFVTKMLETSIACELTDPNDCIVINIASAGQKVKASRMYRDIHKCSLSEAYAAVSKMMDILESKSGVGFGGYCVGKGYVGAHTFDASAEGLEAMM